MRPQPLISVTDVPRSSRWYQRLLGCDSGHGGKEYERLLHRGTLVLQLHSFDVEHHHGRIGEASSRPYGNGVALWFEIDDFDEAVRRAEALDADVVRPPHRNPPDGPGGPAHRELWVRDPDGYLVVLASPDGESPWPDPRVRRRSAAKRPARADPRCSRGVLEHLDRPEPDRYARAGTKRLDVTCLRMGRVLE